MVPLALSVKNFLSYGENTSTLDFRDFSIACLSGRNGHGKSALIDALTWALWGRCRVKIKEEVIKRGATEARVELEFESEGNRYRILRSISKKKGGSQGSLDLQVFDGGSGSYAPLDQGAKAQSAIEKILKMDYNSFICSSFILQGMADEFTKRTPADRKEVLSKILELDEYETLTRKARERAQASGSEAAALEAEASRLDGEIAQKEIHEKKLLGLRGEEETVSESIARYEAIRSGLIGEYESAKSRLDTLARLGGERENVKALLGRLEEELAGVRESIKKDREIVSREKEIEDCYKKLGDTAALDRALDEKRARALILDEQSSALDHKISRKRIELETRAKELHSQIKGLEARASSSGRLKKEIEGIRTRIGECTETARKAEGLREELKRTGGEKEAAAARISELNKRKTEEEQKLHVLAAGDTGAHCPLCESPLEEEARAALAEKLNNAVSRLGGEIRAAGERIAALGDREKALYRELATADAAAGLLPGLHKELGEKEQNLRESEAAAVELGEAGKSYDAVLRTLSGEEFKKEYDAERKEIERKKEALGYDVREHRAVKDALEKLGHASGDKETLERARLGLGLRESAEKKLDERMAEGKKRLEEIGIEVTALGGIESAAKEIRDKMSAADERLSALKKQKEELVMDISRSVSALERIGQLAVRKNEIKDKIAEAKRGMLIFQELAKAFGKNGLQALIIEHAVPEIEAEANKILGRLTEGTMTLSLEMVRPTQKGGEKETLEIYIGDSSGTRSYETFSGGEAFRIDFALRVGISKFIANRSGAQLRTLVIDEGFGTQDRDGLSQFVQVINSIKDDFDKILAITHVDELKERFPVRIEVTKEPGSGSRFEVVYT
ncbi:MAG: SMC family ATPase [Thermodesulfobacteriota bacterium]